MLLHLKKLVALWDFLWKTLSPLAVKAIWSTAEEYKLPLISCKNGYFIAETDDEIAEYNRNIQKRIDGMEKTRKMVNKNYEEWKK